ncbi:ABC transporter permease [Epidermidibacterium keratini]|uniref:ABC transporter permease n=1 Tax=Epidermidibacterium keratini TaxID=1891644 RepID=UPI00384E7D71
MPIPGWAVLIGHAAASLVRNLISTVIVGIVAVLLGYRAAGGLGGVLGAAGVVALWITAITAIFTVVGLFAKTPQAASGYGFIFLFLPYLSSAFVPIATMPSWLKPIATFQPCTPVIESIRALLNGHPQGADLLLAFAWCGGFVAVATLLCIWAFPRRISH